MNVFIAHAEADQAVAGELKAFLRLRGLMAETETGERGFRYMQPSDVVVALWSQAATFSPWRMVMEKRMLEAWAEQRLVLVKLDHNFLPVGLRDLPAIDASFDKQRELVNWPEVARLAKDAMNAALAERAQADEAPPGAPPSPGVADGFGAAGGELRSGAAPMQGRIETERAAKPAPSRKQRSGALGLWLIGLAVIGIAALGVAMLQLTNPIMSAPDSTRSVNNAISDDLKAVDQAADQLQQFPFMKDAPAWVSAVGTLDAPGLALLDSIDSDSAAIRRLLVSGDGQEAERLAKLMDERKRKEGELSQNYASFFQFYQSYNVHAQDLERQLAKVVSDQRDAAQQLRATEAARKKAEADAQSRQAWLIGGVAATVGVGLVALLLIVGRGRARRSPTFPAKAAASAPPPPSEIVAPVLFISYSHADDATVTPLVAIVEGHGRTVWIDKTGINTGDGWAGEIVKAIKAAHGVVVMCSKHSFESDHVKREVYLADKYKKPMAPMFLEQAALPEDFEYFFANVQWLELWKLPEADRAAAIGQALKAV